MKQLKILSALVLAFLLIATVVFAATTAGRLSTDANGRYSDGTAIDSTKTITATLTGTKPAFANTSLIAGTHALYISCVNPTTGAAAAGRVLVNNAGTEIPVVGLTGPYLIPSSASTLAFGKYSTGTATDSVKCTAFGQ